MLTNKIINRIDKAVKDVLFEHQVFNYEKFKIYFYWPKENKDDFNYVKTNRDFIFNFLNDGYIAKGYKKFDGCFDKKSLSKNAVCIKVAKDLDNEIIAIAAYTDYLKGIMCIGITATINEQKREIGKQALISIIKEDILNWKNYYWCECSETVEHYYEKYGGIHIPSKYAEIFGIKDITFIDDFYYERYVAGEEEPLIKTIYGFNSKETYDKILAMEDRCIMHTINVLEKEINELKEDIDLNESKNNAELQILEKHRLIIKVFFDAKCQGVNEFTKELLEKLKTSLAYVEKCYNEKNYPDEWEERVWLAVENAKDILNSSTELKCNLLA